MIRNCFTLRDEKNRVLISFLGLKTLNMTVVVSSREQLDRAVLVVFLQRLNIKFVHLLAQEHSLACAQRFAPLVSGEILSVEIRFGQLVFLKLAQEVLFRRVEGLIPGRKVLVFEV